MNATLRRLRQTELWIAWVRLAAVPWAILEVGVLSGDYPAGYELWAWAVTGVLAVGAAVLFWVARRELSPRGQRTPCFLALAFDSAVVAAYVFVYSFETGTPVRQLLVVPVIEAAVRYGVAGVAVVPAAVAPVLVLGELFRAEHFDPRSYNLDNVTFPLGLQTVVGLIVGRLTDRLRSEAILAETRAEEAERLRDELRGRADLLDATNRCARALASSLELEDAFAAFIGELKQLLPFDRVAIVVADGASARVIATAGAGAETVFPAGSVQPVAGSLLERVLDSSSAAYREDIAVEPYPEERVFLELGLRSRLAAPLYVGTHATGMIALQRAEPASFSADEIEVAELLGRMAGTALQNIRAFDAEHKTVEELRRLTALRADFVSLVSHELRSPLASVMGASRTLKERWRQLSPAQRESFLGVIDDATARLAALIGDVLDTSRIEAGTFSYTFTDVDVAELARESAAAAAVGQDEVRVRAEVRGPVAKVRGDRERLRQILANLIDNAVRYTSAGDDVEVEVYQQDGRLAVDVRDHGPGVAPEHQHVIFEKFGRANAGGKVTQGTGLGLFIARSIAEAHGGSLELRSGANGGATFTLTLPLDAR